MSGLTRPPRLRSYDGGRECNKRGRHRGPGDHFGRSRLGHCVRRGDRDTRVRRTDRRQTGTAAAPSLTPLVVAPVRRGAAALNQFAATYATTTATMVSGTTE